MSSREFAEWQAYDRLDPIGSFRLEAHLAQLCAAIVNHSPLAARHTHGIEDFLVRFDPVARKSDEEIAGAFRAFAARAGASA